MFLKIARDISKPQSFAIMDLLKRSTGLSVNELAKALKMSYMGIKQHCIDLEKKGFLDTWRRPGEAGRPEKAYRLTEKAAAFYPEAGNEMTLEILHSIQDIYGSSAADKLLFNHFTKKTEFYLKKVKGTTPLERAISLAKIRDRQGYCSEVKCDLLGGWRIVEFHHPLKEIASAFPGIKLIETQMMRKILMTEVQRLEEQASGLSRVSWSLAPLAQAMAS